MLFLLVKKGSKRIPRKNIKEFNGQPIIAFPIQRAFKLTPEKLIIMFYPDFFKKRSQDLVVAHHDAGQFYWGKAEAFKLQQPFFSCAASPYILPRHLVQDKDTKEDWKHADLMFQVLKHSGELV